MPPPPVAVSSRAPWWARRASLGPGAQALVPLVAEQRRLFLATLALTALNAALEGVGIGLLIPFLDGLLQPDAVPVQTGIGWLDRGVLGVGLPAGERLLRVAGVILASIWLRAGVSYLANVCSARMTEGLIDRVRRALVDQVQALSLPFFSTARTGDLLNTLTHEANRLQNLLGIARMFVVNGMMIATYVTVILLLSWPLALFALVLCGGLLVSLNHLLRNLRASGRVIGESRGALAALAAELIGGIRTVTEFGTQAYEAARFAAVSEQARRENVEASVRSGVVGPVSQGVAATILIGIVLVAVFGLVLPGRMSAAALLAFLVVLMRMLPLLQSLNTSRAEWAVFRGSLDRVTDLLRSDDKPFLRDGARPLPALASAIELDGVGFEYEPGQPVITDLSLTIRRGEVVALVGASGAGKSTLADLVARFYDPTEGHVRLDGHDLRSYRLADLRQRIAVVNQHTFLFNDTVRANIAYARPGATHAEVVAAAREANALGFVEALPDGFDTVLGERGTRLSGGQRQRVAIARAMLRDPDLLILDEATSALDSVSERLVQESVERLMAGRTVIVIAHRLSTVEAADRVVVLERGAIDEEGTYADLIAQRGQLWRYHTLQYEMA